MDRYELSYLVAWVFGAVAVLEGLVILTFCVHHLHCVVVP